MPSTGRYYILVLASKDFLDRTGASQPALLSCIDIIQKFLTGATNLIVLHPLQKRFEWTDLPPNFKKFAEMRTYGLAKKEDEYEIFNVSKDVGLIAVIRPDGYIDILALLSSSKLVEAYFSGCLIRI
jgi:phenol 2-monooxygenase